MGVKLPVSVGTLLPRKSFTQSSAISKKNVKIQKVFEIQSFVKKFLTYF